MSIEARIQKAEHQIELLEQAMKVKPVNIKREVIRESFDHRLLLFNVLILFINIFLLLDK